MLFQTVAVMAIAFSLPAYASDKSIAETTIKTKTETDAKGGIKETRKVTTEQTDAKGEYTSTETEMKVKKDAYGNGEKVTATTTVDDPKGLFNKTKTKVVDKEKMHDGKTTVLHEKTVNGKTVEKTKAEE